MSLDDFRKRLRLMKKATSDDQRRATERVRFWMVLSGALLAAACQFITLPETDMPWVRGGGILGALLAFFGGYWTYRADRHASAALELADEATESAQAAETAASELSRALRRDFQALRNQHLRLRRLLALSNILREGVEQALSARGAVDVRAAANTMMLGCYRAILAALGCEAGERWTLTIYRETDGVLDALAALTVDRGAQTVPVRSWAIGQGFAGATFARNNEIVLDDAQHPAVLAMLIGPATPDPNEGPKYRSVAAVPIRVDEGRRAWGVAIATSDRAGRFDPGDNSEGALSAQAVRLIAGMVALLAASEGLAANLGTEAPAPTSSGAPR